MELNNIQALLQERLEPNRYYHTLGVMYTAASLCMQYEVDINQGMLAGLLHDCGKEYKSKKQHELCGKYKIELTEPEENNHALIHAKLGAYMAEHFYDVSDKEVLSAIRCHTTGKPNMSTLEKIIYIADYIEPHRHLPYVDKLRKLAFQDLDETICMLSAVTINHLIATESIIESTTIETYNYYSELINNI